MKLFERQGRRAVLTEAGRKILRHAQAVLESSAGLERAAQELRDGWEAELSVVVDGALPQERVTHCLRRFADPDVPTRLRVDIEYQRASSIDSTQARRRSVFVWVLKEMVMRRATTVTHLSPWSYFWSQAQLTHFLRER